MGLCWPKAGEFWLDLCWPKAGEIGLDLCWPNAGELELDLCWPKAGEFELDLGCPKAGEFDLLLPKTGEFALGSLPAAIIVNFEPLVNSGEIDDERS